MTCVFGTFWMVFDRHIRGLIRVNQKLRNSSQNRCAKRIQICFQTKNDLYLHFFFWKTNKFRFRIHSLNIPSEKFVVFLPKSTPDKSFTWQKKFLKMENPKKNAIFFEPKHRNKSRKLNLFCHQLFNEWFLLTILWWPSHQIQFLVVLTFILKPQFYQIVPIHYQKCAQNCLLIQTIFKILQKLSHRLLLKNDQQSVPQFCFKKFLELQNQQK